MTIQTQYKTIGEIMGTNTIRFRTGTEAMSVAIKLLETHTPGAPVIDNHGKYVGFISEFDLLKVLEAGKDLGTLKVEDIMARKLVSVSESTPIEVAVKLMEQKHLLNLPVVKNGALITTVSRHDLLRAALNVDLGIEH